MICLVVSGSGRSTVGEHTSTGRSTTCSHPALELRQPHGEGRRRDLFIVSDRSRFERLDLLREELQ